MMILNEIRGNYSQTLEISQNGGDNTVEVKRDGKTLFNGTVKQIENSENILRFLDERGKKHEYIKHQICTWT